MKARAKFCGIKLIMAIALGILTATLLAYQKPTAEPNLPPNILLLMADDWNWPQSAGILDPNIQTPTFDRIAREGIMFRNAFVASPSCTPCRASLLTGRHPWELETGVHLWGALPAKFDVFTDILEDAGYFVGYTGKGWGPGVLEHTGRTHNPAGSIKVSDFREFFRDRPEDKPFCFWFNSSDPHRPYEWQSGIESGMDVDSVIVPDIFPDTLETRTDICDYFFEVERFDAAAGEVLDYLELAGELDNTLVVITGDNGMPFPRAKMTLYDLGTKVPLAIRWPEKVKRGRAVDDFVSLPDLAPTFLEAAGIKPPEAMSAQSFMDILLSEKSGLIDPKRDRVFSSIELHCGRYPMRAIRIPEFLYIRNYETEQPINLCIGYWESEAGYSPTWMAVKALPPENEIYQRVAGQRPEEELYHIKRDPFQLQNLAEDPEFSEIKAWLARDLDKELRRTGDPRILGRHEEVFYIPHSENQNRKRAPKPNILWIVSEDNSPFLGCYGDELAVTPHLDKLASEGFLYTHAYANAPVCAPARNTIITGVYAISNGNQHMRSVYPLSDSVKMFPRYLRQAGYYCTNNAKEDYNTVKQRHAWDDSSREAHYSNRKEGQPFFHVKNIGTSHESSIHKSVPENKLVHNPARMKLPPYHPDTKEMRHDWALYYDKITAMDREVGEVLRQLEDDGLADDTIVFYYSDHGGVLGRSKRYVYESGTHVPFLVRIPEKYRDMFPADKPGTQIDRLISFVDLAPTMLSIAGIPVQEYMQGNAFLGSQKTDNPEYVHMFRGRMDEWYDMSRSVRDLRFRYIRNFMPFRIYGQRVAYLWRAPSMVSWEKAFLAGECNDTQSIFWDTKSPEELYDTESDPWEVNNLINDPAYAETRERMSKANRDWMGRIFDSGFIPEADMISRTDKKPVYDYMRLEGIPLDKMMEAAEMASLGKEENREILTEYLKNEDSAVRYWGATGLLILGEKAAPAKKELKKALVDVSPNVVVAAAEALHNLGEQEIAQNALLKTLDNAEDKARCHALNVIVHLDLDGPAVRAAIGRLYSEQQEGYALRIVDWLKKNWDITPEK